MVGLGVGVGVNFNSGLCLGSITPLSLQVFLTGDTPDNVSSSFTDPVVYINSDGNYAIAPSNTAYLKHSLSTGKYVGLGLHGSASQKNTYARPSTDAVGDHFATGSASVTVVTDATAPITDDFTNHDQVWQVSNSTGSDITIEWDGATGNTADHNIQLTYNITSGTGVPVLSISGAEGVRLEGLGWSRVSAVDITPVASTGKLRLVIPDGVTIRFFAAALIAAQANNTAWQGYDTMWIDTAGAADTRDDNPTRADFGEELGDEFTFCISGVMYGSENQNAAFFSLNNSADRGGTTLDLYLNASGTPTIFAKDGGVTGISATTFKPRANTSSYRLPMRFELCLRWDGTQLDVFSQGEKRTDIDGVPAITGSVPTTIDGVDFNLRGGIREFEGYITGYEVYNKALSDAACMTKSYGNWNYFVPWGGQSPAARNFTEDFSTTGNEGAGERVINDLIGFKDGASKTFNNAFGGGSLREAGVNLSEPLNYHLSEEGGIDPNTSGDLAVRAIQNYTGKIDWAVWAQGQGDRDNIPDDYGLAEYQADLETWIEDILIGRFGAEFVIIQILELHDTATDVSFETIRRAQHNLIENNAKVYGVPAYHLPLDVDGVHFENAAQEQAARLITQKALALSGQIQERGTVCPQITAAAVNGSALTITINHDAGDDLTVPATTGVWYVDVDGVRRTVSTVTKNSATEIELTLDSAVNAGQDVKLTYPYGANGGDHTGIVVDNAYYPLPLLYVGDFSVTNNT